MFLLSLLQHRITVHWLKAKLALALAYYPAPWSCASCPLINAADFLQFSLKIASVLWKTLHFCFSHGRETEKGVCVENVRAGVCVSLEKLSWCLKSIACYPPETFFFGILKIKRKKKKRKRTSGERRIKTEADFPPRTLAMHNLCLFLVHKMILPS